MYLRFPFQRSVLSLFSEMTRKRLKLMKKVCNKDICMVVHHRQRLMMQATFLVFSVILLSMYIMKRVKYLLRVKSPRLIKTVRGCNECYRATSGSAQTQQE